MCIFVCVVYLCVMYAHLCVSVHASCVYRGQKRTSGCCSIIPTLFLWDTVSQWTWSWVGGCKLPPSVSDLPTSAGVAGTCLFMPGFLHWSQGFELTSSCFCSKCSYLLSHLPNPITNLQPVIAEVDPAHHSATVSMAHACLSVRFSTPA